MNIKTEEAKLREEIEKLIKEKIGSIPIDLTPYIRKLVLKREFQAKLQQLLADKKMFKDAVEKLDYYELYCKMIDEMGDEDLDQHWVMSFVGDIEQELLKTLGIQEEENDRLGR